MRGIKYLWNINGTHFERPGWKTVEELQKRPVIIKEIISGC